MVLWSALTGVGSFLLDTVYLAPSWDVDTPITIPFSVPVVWQCSSSRVCLLLRQKIQNLTSQQTAVCQFSIPDGWPITTQWVDYSSTTWLCHSCVGHKSGLVWLVLKRPKSKCRQIGSYWETLGRICFRARSGCCQNPVPCALAGRLSWLEHRPVHQKSLWFGSLVRAHT